MLKSLNSKEEIIKIDRFCSCLQILFEGSIVTSQEFDILLGRIRAYGQKGGVNMFSNEVYQELLRLHGNKY